MNLIEKYNVPAPRYTSYPTVPHWADNISVEDWKTCVRETFLKTNDADGISLYIHLPFCESLCTYCACNTRITVNHKVELPYLDAVLKEWHLYLKLFGEKPKLKEIHLGGGTPTFFSPENLEYLIVNILKTSEMSPEHSFSFEGHPSNTSTAHLQTLYKLGFRRVSFGIQDFDLIVQDVIHRFQSYEEVETVVTEARRIGYTSVNFDLVYGLPFQKLDTITDTLNKVIQLKPDRIAFYSYAHVPWIKPGQRKFTEKDLPIDLEKRKLYEKGLELFNAAGYIDIGMDHFSLKTDELFTAMTHKRLHRNFMGYSDSYTELMVGLGVSSISDTWNAFSQNVKVVELYQTLVEEGKFPLLKGHLLSREDEIIRKHILNIMCQGETSWENDKYTLNLLNEGLQLCEDLETDGLIQLFPNKLVVTEKGKGFLRNICVCFDHYYQEQTTNAQVFSTSV